jgi:hypothetical protein
VNSECKPQISVLRTRTPRGGIVKLKENGLPCGGEPTPRYLLPRRCELGPVRNTVRPWVSRDVRVVRQLPRSRFGELRNRPNIFICDMQCSGRARCVPLRGRREAAVRFPRLASSSGAGAFSRSPVEPAIRGLPHYLGNETECKVDQPPTEAAPEAARTVHTMNAPCRHGSESERLRVRRRAVPEAAAVFALFFVTVSWQGINLTRAVSGNRQR